jgi:predicted phage-related endonuclease
MTRHFENQASVQAQLDEIRELKERVAILESEMKDYMDDNDLDILKGETTCYDRTWVNDSLQFDTTKFKNDNPNLYEQYKTKKKAGGYRYTVKAMK